MTEEVLNDNLNDDQKITDEIISARKTILDWKKNLIGYDAVVEQIKAFGVVYTEI